MLCVKCAKEIDEDSVFCKFCGKKQIREATVRHRANGEGSIYRRGNKWIAYTPPVYYVDDHGNLRKKMRSKTCATKKDAATALAEMLTMTDVKTKKEITFKSLYDKWLPTHEASKSTLDCYKAAIKYFEPVWFMHMDDIDIDDLQECLDTCGKGKRTQQNMKAVCGLVYKYGIPRQAIPDNLNLATFLKVGGDEAAHRASFTAEQIKAIKAQIGITPKAEYVYCLIYLGFRPSEFLSLTLDSYDANRQCFIGGGKTDAGTNRIVTIAPKILPYIQQIAAGRTDGAFFHSCDGKAYTLQNFTEAVFYPTLKAAGIDNPMVEVGGGIERHKFTPHSCRHTFATLLKGVVASDKDKLELIGHSSDEMLRYYQDVSLDDLRKITDNL